MRQELALALEVRARAKRLDRLICACALGLRRCHLVQLGEVPAERDQRRLTLGAGRGEALHLAERLSWVAAARCVDERLERGLRRIADDRLDVFMA